MNVNDLLRLLRRFRVLAVVIALLVIAGGSAVALRAPDRYASNATVIVQPKVGPDGQVGDVQQIDFLIPQYLAQLGSNGFISTAGETVPQAAAEAPIGVSTSAAPGTGIIDIQVTSTVRAAVAPWAAALANTLIAKAGNKFADLSLVDQPETPSEPYAPNRTLALAITFVIALSAAIVSVILAAALRARRDGAAEIRERFGIRVLTEIPTLSRRVATLEPEQLALNTRALPVIDAFQTLRASVSYLLADKPHPWFAVVSARGREGKSFVSVHLSWLLGALKNETLLLDANARHPTAHQMLRLPAAPGIDELDATNLGSVMQRTAREHLGFIAAGHPDRHPAEVASAHLPLLLKQIDGHDVTLVVDTPAMAGAAETVIYAAGCGVVLLVIDARRRDFADVEQMLLTLNDRRIEVLGVVINRVRRGSFSKLLARRRAPRTALQPNVGRSDHGDPVDGRTSDEPAAGLVRTNT